MVSMFTTREESSNTSPWALTMLTVVKELMNMAEPTGVPVAYNASSSAKENIDSGTSATTRHAGRA